MEHRWICLRRQSGAGLIEVLIAIVISAFALLGLAGLQVSAMRFQKVAHFRSTAIQFTSELADRVRANLVGARAGNYNPTASSYTTSAPTAPSAATCNGTVLTSCSAAELAALDIYNWRLNLNRGMAGGWGEISGDVTSGFIIRVYFKEPTKSDGVIDTNCRGAALATTDTDVRCFATAIIP